MFSSIVRNPILLVTVATTFPELVATSTVMLYSACSPMLFGHQCLKPSAFRVVAPVMTSPLLLTRESDPLLTSLPPVDSAILYLITAPSGMGFSASMLALKTQSALWLGGRLLSWPTRYRSNAEFGTMISSGSSCSSHAYCQMPAGANPGPQSQPKSDCSFRANCRRLNSKTFSTLYGGAPGQVS